MPNTYCPVQAHSIDRLLVRLKFSSSTCGREVVYERRSVRNPNVMIKVYSSVAVNGSQVRQAGRDSLKVCVVFSAPGGRSFGIGKFPPIPRVNSEESVLRRLRERLEAACGRAVEWMDEDDARARRRDRERGAGRHPREWQERLEEKAEFARREREQEHRGFESDPDFQEYLRTQERVA
jgi:hypothetical protein